MGQTLSHGVYLPNEGERNCYAGLASNWQILNTAVGAIAEKAPLVHTHGNITNDGKVGTTANLPLITGTGGAVQAGSFGTSANTFCEGNDSRLSDARTPVAHTHSKNDITNMFNSANSWTGDNTFKGIYQNQGDTNFIIPRGTNTVKGDLTTSGSFTLMFKDKNNGNLTTSGIGYLTLGQNSSGSYVNIGVETVGSTDNTRHSNSIAYKIDPTTNDNTAQFYPVNNNATDLGTSTNKWKSLNGINPGALSLPNVRAAVADPISTVGWNLSGSRNKYPPTEDGWFYIRVAGTGSCTISIHNGGTDNSYPTWFNTSTGGYAALVVPCEKGISLYIYISATSIEYCSFHPCLGNV